MASNDSKNIFTDFSDPKKTGMYGLIMAVVSLFIFGVGLSVMAMTLGAFGVYNAYKFKAGKMAYFLNILAIIIGLVSRVGIEFFLNK